MAQRYGLCPFYVAERMPYRWFARAVQVILAEQRAEEYRRKREEKKLEEERRAGRTWSRRR